MHALGDAIEKSPDWTVCWPAGRPSISGGARLLYVILARLREKKMGWEFYEEALKREDDDAGVVMRARAIAKATATITTTCGRILPL